MFFRVLFAIVLIVSLGMPAQGGELEHNTFFSKGQTYYENSEYEKAYQVFFKLFVNDPENLKINFHLGKAAFAMRDYEAAVMAFERALIVDPGSGQAKLELAKSYYRLGSMGIAGQYFEEVLKTDLSQDARSNIETILAEIKTGQH